MKQLCQLLLFYFTTLLFSTDAIAQPPIRALIDAENNFAAFTAAHTIKEGFLHYMDSTAVVFQQGKAKNGMEYYGNAPAGKAVLFWQPAFSVLSASGDLGMNTGPYTLKPSSKDTIVARGNFSSIWKKNKAGEFKLLIDLGNSYKATHPPIQSVREISLHGAFPASNYADILSWEDGLNQAIQTKGWEAVLPHLHSAVHFNLSGQLPVNGPTAVMEALRKSPVSGEMKSMDGEISKAGDLAYVYGSVVHNARTGNYLRVWIRENNQWKLVLQTMD